MLISKRQIEAVTFVYKNYAVTQVIGWDILIKVILEQGAFH